MFISCCQIAKKRKSDLDRFPAVKCVIGSAFEGKKDRFLALDHAGNKQMPQFSIGISVFEGTKGLSPNK